MPIGDIREFQRPNSNNQARFEQEATEILHNLALERTGWKRWFNFLRWYISDEPLRNNAARLLRNCNIQKRKPIGTQYVGDDSVNEYNPDYCVSPGEILVDHLVAYEQNYRLPDDLKTEIDRVIKGKRDIDEILAEELELILGIDADVWLKMQTEYNAYVGS